MKIKWLKWIWVFIRNLRRIGLYQFVDPKGRKFNILLVDSQASVAINDANNHAARQFVLYELRRLVAVDSRCPEFEVPKDVFLWGHPVRGFKSIERLRDARLDERKEILHPLRDAVTGYIEYIS